MACRLNDIMLLWENSIKDYVQQVVKQLFCAACHWKDQKQQIINYSKRVSWFERKRIFLAVRRKSHWNSLSRDLWSHHYKLLHMLGKHLSVGTYSHMTLLLSRELRLTVGGWGICEDQASIQGFWQPSSSWTKQWLLQMTHNIQRILGSSVGCLSV